MLVSARFHQRLDKIYDDKLDGAISNETYNRKRAEYDEQLKALLDTRAKHMRANAIYFDVGLHIFELAQKADEIYKKKATPTQKRELLSLAFSNQKLKDEKLIPVYQNAFQLVAKRAENKTWLGC